MKKNELKKFYFDMEKEVMDMVLSFIGDDFLMNQIQSIGDVEDYLKDDSSMLDIEVSDVLIYYLCKDSLNDRENAGLCDLIEYYKKEDSSFLNECFIEASNVIVNCGTRVCGTVAMNIVALHYIGEMVSSVFVALD